MCVCVGGGCVCVYVCLSFCLSVRVRSRTLLPAVIQLQIKFDIFAFLLFCVNEAKQKFQHIFNTLPSRSIHLDGPPSLGSQVLL